MDEHTLNDLLECSVCLERLDTSSKVLPCQHTFCRKCLEVIYDSHQELRCPECRILVQCKIDDLPPNVLLMRILEGMKNALATTKQTLNAPNTPTTLKPEADCSPIPERDLNLKQPQQRQNLEQQKITAITQNDLPRQRPNQEELLTQPNSPANTILRRFAVPHAYAIHDFESNEPSDLKFKKGDLIMLKYKIDNYWYVGQKHGIEGAFPCNFVQIVVPLPSPQCIAMYDFKMGPKEEEGCLSFKKGTIIQVIRRVDQNWAEGRIGPAIGIFPIAFVELNNLAKQLLDNTGNPQILDAARHREKTEATEAHTVSSTLPSEHSKCDSSSNTPPPLPACSNVSISTPSTSATNPKTTNYSTSCSNFTNPIQTLTNAENAQEPTTTKNLQRNAGMSSTVNNMIRSHNNDFKHKRHSLNAPFNNGTSALSLVQNNRHSAEILSIPCDLNNEAALLCPTLGNDVASSQPTKAREQQQPQKQITSQSQILPLTADKHTQARHNVLKTCIQQNIPPKLPWGYIALYPYKPTKADELELKKGCVYIVMECCLDGWFKGKNWKDACGVFPGNYVIPLRVRDQQQLMHDSKFVPSTQASFTQKASQTQTFKTAPPSQGQPTENIETRLAMMSLLSHLAAPPDLPPRHLKPSDHPTAAATTIQEYREKEASKEKHSTTGCISTSTSSPSTSTSLKKFLIHIKARSKSPNTLQQQHSGKQKRTPQEPTAQRTDILNAVHSRSGSCPSQLFQQHIPNQIPTNVGRDAHSITQQQPQHPGIKSNKEEASQMTSPRLSINSTLRSIYTHQIQHQQQHPQQQQPPPQSATSINHFKSQNAIHRKSHSLDAPNILIDAAAPAPLTSSSNINYKQNVVIQNQIKGSKTHISTTNAQQNSNSSRFRCIAPYSTNNDIELEMQSGDIIHVYYKQSNGWCKGANSRTKKRGLFPASFVEPDL